MKRKIKPEWRVLWGVIAAALLCQLSIVAAPPSWETPPGWTETRGGAGGRVIRVTTLDARGPGSLGEALAAEGPRIIEFAVAGKIDLGGRGLRLSEAYVTVAGETAPSPGITLVNGGMSVRTHDVIVRHLRIRPGAGGRAKRSGWDSDGLTVGGHDIIVDHCSLEWATDENLSASGPRFRGDTPEEWRNNTARRITFSHCLVGEGLDDSTHSKGPHSKGTLLHDNVNEIALIGNLYTSNVDRNPLFKGGVRAAVVNNLIYNPGERAMQFGHVPGQWEGRPNVAAELTIVGNVVRKGPSSADEMALLEVWPQDGTAELFMADNLFFDAKGAPLTTLFGIRDRARVRPGYEHAKTSGSGYELHLLALDRPPAGIKQLDEPPLWPPRLRARPASATQDWVLANVGARPWDRDAEDRRLVDEVRQGGGRVRDDEPVTVHEVNLGFLYPHFSE